FAPKGTPRDIIDRLAAALDQALNDPGVQTRLADLGGSLPTKDERTPAKFESFVKAEIARWSPILKAPNVEAKCRPGCHGRPRKAAESLCRGTNLPSSAGRLGTSIKARVHTRKRRWLLAWLLRYSPPGIGESVPRHGRAECACRPRPRSFALPTSA